MIYQKGSNLFNVAIYIRLSREDGDKEESDSVGNQRKLLTEYVNKHDDFILDDVYSDATDIIGLKQNPTNGRRFSPIFLCIGHFSE